MTEKPQYLTEQLITYIGNKRSLLEFIGEAIGGDKVTECNDNDYLSQIIAVIG